MTSWTTVLTLSVLTGTCLSSSLLRNETDSVFGSDVVILPLAFGDFNSDKLTDLIVIDAKDRSKIYVKLAKPQIFSIASESYFSPMEAAKRDSLLCYANHYDVVGAAPGDFDGDGGMDIAVVLRRLGSDDEGRKEPYLVNVLYGDHDHEKDVHKLVCPSNWKENAIYMQDHPLVIDGNGDNIADLYGTTNSNKGIWIFSTSRTSKPYHYVTLEEDSAKRLRIPHANAFVDLNTDGNADLFVTSEDSFELWQNVGAKKSNHFEHHKSVPYPACKSGAFDKCIGQSVFFDFDLDGLVDMVFPACEDETCATSSLYFATMRSLWSGEQKDFLAMPLSNMDQWQFDVSDDGDEHNLYPGLSPHVGDINLDGYPDILIRMKHKATKETQIHLLLNVKDDSSPTPYKRGFMLQTELMHGLNNTVAATFYDLYENGLEDVMLVQRGGGSNDFRIGIFGNASQDSDAYFVKVIVLSGICYKDCPGNHIDVPYGTNLPGQTICYKTQRPSAEETSVEIQSCAPQLTQTAHHALQQPYTIFGLGMSPNFLDFMYVNVTNASSISHGKSWPQIIPNSQLYVIPNPPDYPSLWQVKLFITPSRGITLTGLSLVGTCGVCVIIILFFHWRERRQDRREKLQQPNQFHFDAM